MDGGEDEVARLGSIEREAHGFRIAHFAHHQDIRIFAHGIEQRLLKTGSVAADFALANERTDRFELVFDRMLNRDDVARFGLVNFLDQCGESG